jgi:Lon protease-like protein
MSELLPLFPLPNVVLFPSVFLPLHIFEPRYREMIADALAGDRLIGLVLLRPGYERDYEGRPPVYPIGCRGVMTHAERLPDGRYNIVLRGLDRFRIVSENQEQSYRRAAIDILHEPALDAGERSTVRERRSKIESMLASIMERGGGGAAGADTKLPPAMSDEDLIHALAQYLDLEPLEKQAILEQPCLLSRAQSLIELLEMRAMAGRTPRAPASNLAH